MDAIDQELIRQVEEVMAGDVHGGRTLILYLSWAIKEQDKEKINYYRKVMRAYVSRRKAGEMISRYDLEKEMKDGS